MARAADHAERRADNIIKAIAGVEKRIEALAEETPHKSEVVMTADLEALLTEHAHELDNHLDKLKADLMSVLEVSTTTAPHRTPHTPLLRSRRHAGTGVLPEDCLQARSPVPLRGPDSANHHALLPAYILCRAPRPRALSLDGRIHTRRLCRTCSVRARSHRTFLPPFLTCRSRWTVRSC